MRELRSSLPAQTRSPMRWFGPEQPTRCVYSEGANLVNTMV
jgi:hypothetical protein